MADRFVVEDRPAPDLERPWRLIHGAVALAGGAGLMIAEALELGPEDLLNGPADDGLAHIDGKGFDGIEVEVKARTGLAVGPADNNFPPPVSGVA
jgi:hypothetical protein